MSAVARPPCTPITNEAAPAARSKGSFSFANLMSKSRSNSPAPKPKKETVDLAAVYGTEFARAVAADQFLNGGRLEDSIARVQRANDKMARRRAEKLGVPYVPDATAPVRGPNGELFRDVQDETERRGLLRNAYKGMPENAKYNKGMRPEEDSDNTDEDSSASWAHYQPGQPVARRDSARNEFFNSSFAPVRRA